MERDVSDYGMRDVAYENELIGLAKTVPHWRSYLWGQPFLIRTDHYTFKFLLEQHIITSLQQHWVSKLMSFDITVEYRATQEGRRCPIQGR